MGPLLEVLSVPGWWWGAQDKAQQLSISSCSHHMSVWSGRSVQCMCRACRPAMACFTSAQTQCGQRCISTECSTKQGNTAS
jgi:hypothetical protein